MGACTVPALGLGLGMGGGGSGLVLDPALAAGLHLGVALAILDPDALLPLLHALPAGPLGADILALSGLGGAFPFGLPLGPICTSSTAKTKDSDCE